MRAEVMMMAMTEDERDCAWTLASAAAVRASRAIQLLVLADEAGDALLSAAWLALWRAEERMRALELVPVVPRERWSTAA